MESVSTDEQMCGKLLPVILLADDIICLLIEGEIAKRGIDSDLTAFLVAQKEKVLRCFQTWRLILSKARSSIWVTYKTAATAAIPKPLHKPKRLLPAAFTPKLAKNGLARS